MHLKLADPDIPIHICLYHCQFRFHNYDGLPQEERLQKYQQVHLEEPRCHTTTAGMLQHDWDQASEHGWDCSQRQWEPGDGTNSWHPQLHCIAASRVTEVQCQLPYQVSTCSSRSGGSKHPHSCQHHSKFRGHMKSNLPVFKDDDKKDTITYQIWHWDLMVYRCTGWQDSTLLPYIIHFLHGYPGELVRSLGTDITLYGVLTVMDEHYNNVMALDALNQELFHGCKWVRGRQCQSGGCACQGTFKSIWLHSWNSFCQAMLPNWSVMTSMMGCLSDFKQW